MSLYNMLFGENNTSDILLKCLGFTRNDIPRYRDCFIKDNAIIIHTRTGGGNRDYYENEDTCERNYPELFLPNEDGICDPPCAPWNDDLRRHPNFIADADDDFDCTYANFLFSFPDEYKTELTALAENCLGVMPSEKWKELFKMMDQANGK